MGWPAGWKDAIKELMDTITPNVKRLMIHKITQDTITPKGCLSEAIDLVKNPLALAGKCHTALIWVGDAIDAVKSDPDNPYGDDNEAIARALLAELGLDDS